MILRKKNIIALSLLALLIANFIATTACADITSLCGEEEQICCPPYPCINQYPDPTIDTVRALVLYACGSNAATDTLPNWWASIWNPDSQHSVPQYFKDNSLGRYIMLPTPYGRDAGHCFRATIPFDFA